LPLLILSGYKREVNMENAVLFYLYSDEKELRLNGSQDDNYHRV
jgi:hypothetical protein